MESNYDARMIAVLGLGYVGLPLAVEFGKKRAVLGYDLNAKRVEELKAGVDLTNEVSAAELIEAKSLQFTTTTEDLKNAQVYIITVPTPIDEYKRPNLEPLRAASEIVGKVMSSGDIVIYESTVYPGATEEECVPVLERISGLKFNKDFFCGYSPERINPGDKARRLPSIIKLTSGSTPETADFVDNLYSQIVEAGTYKTSSIKIAEAAKVIENTQRDLNIALVNELATIFSTMGIDTNEVLAAAGTKWNFLNFRPGLVGGHCIGVDPYYLTHKAQALGLYPELVLAGRRVNQKMPSFVAVKLLKTMVTKRVAIQGARVLILGATFKEDCPDVRNSLSFDLLSEFKKFGFDVDISDPYADPLVVRDQYGVNLKKIEECSDFDAIVLAVEHQDYVDSGAAWIRSLLRTAGGVFFDLKGAFAIADSDVRL